MTSIIIITVIGAVIALAAYQWVVRKYYWGLNGPPKNNDQTKKRD